MTTSSNPLPSWSFAQGSMHCCAARPSHAPRWCVSKLLIAIGAQLLINSNFSIAAGRIDTTVRRIIEQPVHQSDTREARDPAVRARIEDLDLRGFARPDEEAIPREVIS